MIAMPHPGRREVFIGKDARRTALDYADAVAFLCDEVFPDAEKITLVQDKLNTHDVASLYKRFEPAKARRLAAKIDIHHTPKHGSWLNMAEPTEGRQPARRAARRAPKAANRSRSGSRQPSPSHLAHIRPKRALSWNQPSFRMTP